MGCKSPCFCFVWHQLCMASYDLTHITWSAANPDSLPCADFQCPSSLWQAWLTVASGLTCLAVHGNLGYCADHCVSSKAFDSIQSWQAYCIMCDPMIASIGLHMLLILSSRTNQLWFDLQFVGAAIVSAGVCTAAWPSQAGTGVLTQVMPSLGSNVATRTAIMLVCLMYYWTQTSPQCRNAVLLSPGISEFRFPV